MRVKYPGLNSQQIYPFQVCTGAGGKCETTLDGFYTETAICLVVGFLWLQWGRPTIHRLQRLPASAWQIRSVLRR
ncbi:hypothetical protein JYU34_005909 [Plutella xylostella]|uniref:Uncharacterized protein n=1 Tax=Plutella xylostella TaxID=51655 RepID=A0ABQ7QUF7_PLUXY|nr:hypothetical protein JYU34_005909 [Plutella xylostella]